jgi:hypothetical protein
MLVFWLYFLMLFYVCIYLDILFEWCIYMHTHIYVCECVCMCTYMLFNVIYRAMTVFVRFGVIASKERKSNPSDRPPSRPKKNDSTRPARFAPAGLFFSAAKRPDLTLQFGAEFSSYFSSSLGSDRATQTRKKWSIRTNTRGQIFFPLSLSPSLSLSIYLSIYISIYLSI